MSVLVNKAESRTKWHLGKYPSARNTVFDFMSILSELTKTNSNHLSAYSLLKSCLFNLKFSPLIFFIRTAAEIHLIEKIGFSCLNTEALSLNLILQQFIPSWKIRTSNLFVTCFYHQTEIIKKRRNLVLKVSHFLKVIFPLFIVNFCFYFRLPIALKLAFYPVSVFYSISSLIYWFT